MFVVFLQTRAADTINYYLRAMNCIIIDDKENRYDCDIGPLHGKSMAYGITVIEEIKIRIDLCKNCYNHINEKFTIIVYFYQVLCEHLPKDIIKIIPWHVALLINPQERMLFTSCYPRILIT